MPPPKSPGTRVPVILVDHRDSFTYNLAHLLRDQGAEVTVLDAAAAGSGLLPEFAGLVLGPGPHGPADIPGSVEFARRALGRSPLLGVCLGMQVLGVALGGGVRRATRTVHGVPSSIAHCGGGLLRGLPTPATFVRYHSLVLAEPLPPELRVVGRDEDGDVAAVEHACGKAWGIQFHPESALSEGGDLLARNFLAACAGRSP